MPENILDHIDDVKKNEFFNRSKKDLKVASTLVLASILIIVFSIRMNFFPGLFTSLGGLLLLIAVIVSFIGVINGIRSYWKKEKHGPMRFLVLLGNLMIFGFFVLAVIANALDFLRFLNE